MSMQVVDGAVTEILERGFVLDAGGGALVRVATQTAGRKLGLRRGDHVSVFGGYGGGDVFLSSHASKSILFGRFSIRVPVSSHERRSLVWWL
jgi:hypothetical protein